MSKLVEPHPFAPVLPAHATALMMGTMPPTADRWCMAFHYPNFYNDMWRIFGLVFFDNADYFRVGEEKRFDPEKIKAFLLDKGIGECPTVTEVIREKGNASDDFLTVVGTVDLPAVLAQVPKVNWLFTTGGKATEVLLSVVQPFMDTPLKLPKTNQHIAVNVGERELSIYRLPSSSRAYPMSLANKAAAYRRGFELAGLL